MSRKNQIFFVDNVIVFAVDLSLRKWGLSISEDARATSGTYLRASCKFRAIYDDGNHVARRLPESREFLALQGKVSCYVMFFL